MLTICFDAEHKEGIKQAVAKLLTTTNDYMNIFKENVKDDILESMPDFVKEALNPLLLSTLVSFSILYMFLPQNAQKDRYENVTFKKLQNFINDSKDKDKPRLLVPKKFQPYILRDLPRHVRENLPVPNWKEGQVFPVFKTIPADQQDEAKNLITNAIKNGDSADKLSKDIMNRFGIRKSDADRIADTEVQRARHWAYGQIGKQLGFTQKIFRSYFGRCPICAALDRQIFPADQQVIPQLTHPNCRCSTFMIPSSKV